MNDLDRQLKQALRRCEPLEGFADRVLAQLAKEQPERARGQWPQKILQFPMLRWAIAAIVVIGFGIGIAYRAHETQVEHARALAAKEQVMVALRITGSKLRIAKQKVRAVESGEGKTENSL